MSNTATPTLLIDLIVIPDLLLRGVDPADEKFQFLVADVRDNGVQQPILVREVETESGKKYILVDGRQRLGAAKEARLSEIPVHIQTMDDNEAAIASIRMNLQRSNPPPAAYGKYLKEYLIRNPAMTVAELAAELTYSEQWVQDRLRLTNLTPEFAELVNTGKIAAVNGIALSKLPQDEQPNFVERAKDMSGMEFANLVSERLKALKAAKQKGTAPKAETFVPAPMMRKRSELQELQEEGPSSTRLAAIINEAGVAPGDLAGAAQALLTWVFQMDASTLLQREEEWKADQLRQAEDRARQKVEREKKAADDKVRKEQEKMEKAQKNTMAAVLR